MPSLIKRLKAKEAPIRPFWYPETMDTDQKTGFRVTLRFLSSTYIDEVRKKHELRMRHENKSEAAPSDRRKEIINDILLGAVVKIEDMTVGKLASMIALEPKDVHEMGGFDQPVLLDPTVLGKGAQEAREAILDLLEECETFSTWVNNTATNIGRFQDANWRERVANFQDGQSLTTDASAGTPATAGSAEKSILP